MKDNAKRLFFYHQRGTLFVVGDEGDICEIQKDGTWVKQKRIRHADLVLSLFPDFTAATRTAQGFQGVEVKSKNAASGNH